MKENHLVPLRFSLRILTSCWTRLGLAVILGGLLFVLLAVVLFLSPSEAAPAVAVVAAQADEGGTLSVTDGVTHVVHLPIVMCNFDPETFLPPGQVLIAKHPRITRLTEFLGDGETRVSYFIRNNVDHSIERFSLTFAAEAAVGDVQPVSITTDQPDLFTLSQSDGPEVVTCTFALGTDQVLQVDQKVEVACTYREISGTIVVDSETITPEPFTFYDDDYDQVGDGLETIVDELLDEGQGAEPVLVQVMLDHVPTQADLDVFEAHGGAISTTFSHLPMFAGEIPAQALQDYVNAAREEIEIVGYDYPSDVPPYQLDIAVSNTRVVNVWAGALDGANLADPRFAFDGEPNTSIVVIDTGIDDSHPGFGGYRDVDRISSGDMDNELIVDFDLNGIYNNPPDEIIAEGAAAGIQSGVFVRAQESVRWANVTNAQRIIGWKDILDISATPVDPGGHGSHVAGIAGGTGGGVGGGPNFRGVAYDAHLVSIRLGAAGSWVIQNFRNAFNWAVANKNRYRIVVVNNSNAYTSGPNRNDPFWARASEVAVESGIVVVNAAGNGFDDSAGGDPVGTPAFGAKLLTVGAVNDNDQVAFYSSNGRPVGAGVPVVKPDVVAPGGSSVAGTRIRSVDSNDDDPAADNNYIDMMGTSMAAPHVAGEVALIIDAMTDYDDQNTDHDGGEDEDRWDGVDNDDDDIIDKDLGEWVYDEQFARLVKSIVLMTTFEVPGGEVVPAGRPNAGASNDPHMQDGNPDLDWDRGSKDNKEGYGRIAPDAAIEAVTKEFCAVETDRFGNGLTDKKVWARHLHLYRGKEYKVILDGPGGADYDVYLYQGIPDANGEPVIARRPDRSEIRSITPNTADEEMDFEVQADGLYFLIVRRVTGTGEFTVRLVTPEEWTIMVYMPAELEGADNLDELAFEAINDMEQTGSGEESMKDFQVLVQVDYDERTYDGQAGHEGHAVRYCVRKDHVIAENQYSIVKPITATGVVTEVNMGITQTLAQFADWAVDYFPAKKYALIMWGDGRGYGWKVNPEKALGPGNDTLAHRPPMTVTLDALTMQELREGMAAVKEEINGGSDYKDDTGVDKNVDILGFDMGHMALIEVGRQVQDSVEVMVASEERIHDDGWPYKEVLEGLNDNADDWDAEELGKHIVSVYHTYYITDTKHTLSAVRLNPKPGTGGANKFTELLQQTSEFASEMRTVIEEPDRGTCEDEHDIVEDNVQYHIKHSGRLNVQEFEDHNYIDLQHFARLINQSDICPNDITADTEVISLTQKAGPVVLAEEHGTARPDAHGLSIYFPRDQLEPEDECKEAPDKGDRTCGFDNPFPSKVLYAKDASILVPILRQSVVSDTHPRPQEDLRFPSDATWDEFLHRYYKPVADACVRVGGDCLKVVVGPVGTRWTLSGAGSSDSDGENKDDIPVDWYWDKDPLVDNPAPKPNYPMTSTAPVDPDCTEDCDRDNVDEPDDDPDLVGQVVQWTCPPGVFPFRLMTHDEHNDQNRVHDEETHYVHWKLDDDSLLIICLPPIIIKTPDPYTVTPGDTVDYDVIITNNYPEDTGSKTVHAAQAKEFQATDKLPSAMTLQPDSLICQGQCSFNEETGEINWTGSLGSGESANMEYSVTIDDSIEIIETIPLTLENTITATLNGYIETTTSVVTVTQETCIPLTSVTIGGGDTATVGAELDLFSSYQSSDVTLPITYEWSPDGLISEQGTAWVIYAWDTPGVHTVVLTGTNCEGAAVVTDTHEVTVIGAMFELSVAKFDSPDPVTAGAPLTYTIVVTNAGQVTVTGLVITETYHEWTFFEGAKPEPNEGNNVWYLEMLSPGDYITITISMRVVEALTADTVLTNMVTVDSAETDPLTVAEETLATIFSESALARRWFLIGSLERGIDLHRYKRCLVNTRCLAP